MEDDHVDRPGVEAQQCVELTGTNSSIGLIVLINPCPSQRDGARRKDRRRQSAGGSRSIDCRSAQRLLPEHSLLHLSFAGLVASAERSDPIPSRTRPSNASAPMVLCLKTWESRSSPGLQRTNFRSRCANGERRMASRRYLFAIRRSPFSSLDAFSSLARGGAAR